jgi:hypothetical protein
VYVQLSSGFPADVIVMADLGRLDLLLTDDVSTGTFYPANTSAYIVSHTC